MSVIVTFCLYDGIVMAADSRTTLTKTYPDGRQEVSIRNSEKLDIGGKIVDESEVPHFTLDEGVRFAEAMLKRSCKEREECGESKYSLVMAGAGLQWIHK